ncbi:TetR/AcrR family transcriptional regulator [Celeribacter sp.]|uniref:TetR/AcrR family transcriptional regulator n=1 Tax=Celeribacter sp. TaxID=1890673 RepID=UPI003A92AE36
MSPSSTLPSSSPKPAKRRSIGARQNPEAEAAILTAAIAILTEKGPKGLTMDAVAREAKAGKATIYRWWPTRGALLLAVYARIKGDHTHADTGTFEGDVAAFFDYVFAFWRGDAGRVFALIIAEAQSDADVALALEAYRLERVTAWRAVVERAQARGDVQASVSPDALANTIIAVAWYHLVTGRLDVAGADLAAPIAAGCS